MSLFNYEKPTSVTGAFDTLSADRIAYAGGTDVLTRISSGLITPRALVDLKATGLDAAVNTSAQEVSLGALVTLAEIARHPELERLAPALTAAAGAAATPQIRNRATLAGNILQRPRCPYYRLGEEQCWLNGGTTCHARNGVNTHAAIFDTDRPCVAAHPSDLATVLSALDADVHLRSSSDTSRTVPIVELLTAPTREHRFEHNVRSDELIESVSFVPPDRSVYLKAMDRASWAFALVSVAVVVRSTRGAQLMIRAAAGGVANTPYRLKHLEAALAAEGSSVGAQELATLAIAETQPLPGNRYKTHIVEGLVQSALTAVLDPLP